MCLRTFLTHYTNTRMKDIYHFKTKGGKLMCIRITKSIKAHWNGCKLCTFQSACILFSLYLSIMAVCCGWNIPSLGIIDSHLLEKHRDADRWPSRRFFSIYTIHSWKILIILNIYILCVFTAETVVYILIPIGSPEVNDVKRNHGSVQSEWTSALSKPHWRCSEVTRITAC